MLEKQEQEEQRLNDLNENNPEEEEARGQAEEETQEQTEEEAEILSEIAEYKAKIEALDAKIAEFEAKKIDDNKRELMRKWNYTDEQIDRYIGYIEGETREEIELSIMRLSEDIPPKGANFGDPSPMNGVKQKPKPADPGEVGKTLFERIKHRIWGGGATL